jgi:hypothetical protein
MAWPTGSSVLQLQAEKKREYAAYMRLMARRQRILAEEFDAKADELERSAGWMEDLAVAREKRKD